MAVIMTASDHGPYIIPEYFKPKPNEITKQIVEYADWSIGKFISNAKKKKWFDNTIFVFIADHGTRYFSNLRNAVKLSSFTINNLFA